MDQRRRSSSVFFAITITITTAVATLAALPSPATGADANAAETCRKAVHTNPVEAVTVCEQAYAANTSDAALAEEMLFRRSDAELAQGAYDAATATLDRVAGMPGSEWKRLFRLERRRGMLDYRRDRFAESLTHFRAGQRLADGHADTVSLGQADNDVGNALRRLGDFREALTAYLRSLEAKRRSGDTQLGPLLNNIGDLYRDLEEPENAARFYAEALAAHEKAGRTLDAAHTLESIGVLALDRGDVDGALPSLTDAYDAFVKGDSPPDALRLCVQLARAALLSGAALRAQEWVTRGTALIRDRHLPPSSELVLQDARTRAALGDGRGARAVLDDALRTLPKGGLERIPLLDEAAQQAAQQGDSARAYALLLEFHDADARRRKAEHDQQLAQLRVRFEVDEKDREIRLLGAESRAGQLEARQRTTQLILLALLSLLVVATSALLFQRRHQRARVAEASRRARLDAEIAQYRQAAQDLGIDRQRLQAALDRDTDALLVLEGQRIAALNAAAASWLGSTSTDLIGEAASQRLPMISAALARLDESGAAQPIDVSGMQGTLDLLDDGLALLRLRPLDAPAEAQRWQPAEHFVAPVDSADIDTDATDTFRPDLVALMLASVTAWERSTASTRIELAEQSRVWRVTIDEGRLRVRALERYLSLAKLPRLPRWREVLRTAYFVLAECPLDDVERSDLKTRVEALQSAIRRRALH